MRYRASTQCKHVEGRGGAQFMHILIYINGYTSIYVQQTDRHTHTAKCYIH